MNNNRNIVKTGLFLISLTLFSFSGFAQGAWSLDSCVRYAIENNIQIKQQTLNVNYGENQLKQSKYNLAPNLNAGLGHSFAYGKSLTQLNTYTNQNSQNSDISLSTEVTLFNGMSKLNTVKAREFELQSALLDLEKAKDDISLAVAAAYLEILFNKELVGTSREQTLVTKQQIEFNSKQVEAGVMAKGKLLETESQLANEELALTNYENQLQLSLLNLMQLLEIQVSDSFDIVIPEFNASMLDGSLLNSEEVFNKAVAERPEILSKEYKLRSVEKESAIAKAQLYPSLSAGASYYNNYNDQYQKIAGYTSDAEPQPIFERIPFSEQIENNNRTQIYFSLRIPIFNGLQARTNYNNSFINYENSKHLLQNEKNKLRKEIEQVHLNAVSAMKKFYSSEKAVQSSEEAFRYVEEKFNLGIVTPLEYNDSKNKVFTAKSSYIQAKYEYIFRVKILDFYNGKEITL
jgi:outer membrane protein